MVAELTAEGSSTREIAEVLGTSHTTIERDLTGTNVPDSPVEAVETVTNVPLDAVAVLAASDKVKAVLAKKHTGDEESYTPIEYLVSAAKLQAQIAVLIPLKSGHVIWHRRGQRSGGGRS